MDINTQMIIRSNPNLYRFLREESYWYKYLNRDPSYIKEIEKRMKNKYKLTVSDKLDRLNQSMSLLNGFMDIMK
jgi:hypothetical protein